MQDVEELAAVEGDIVYTNLRRFLKQMGDDSTKRAAEEYLATRLTEDGLTYEETANRDAAVQLAPAVWKLVADTMLAKCQEWNGITREQTFACKETAMGDLRIWCAGRPQQMTVHYDSKKLLVVIKNGAREEHQRDVLLRIEGHRVEQGRSAHLTRNGEAINLDLLLLGELRVLAGLSRQIHV